MEKSAQIAIMEALVFLVRENHELESSKGFTTYAGHIVNALRKEIDIAEGYNEEDE